MTGVLRIPDKVENIDMISGVDFSLDTKGLGCLLKPVGGDIAVKINASDRHAFNVSDGETFDFCGKIYFRHASGTPVAHCLYYRTL